MSNSDVTLGSVEEPRKVRRSLRILHYSVAYAPAWSLGGPPRSISNLCEGLAARAHSVTVFTTKLGLEDRSDIPDATPVQRGGVEVHYFPLSSGLGTRSARLERAVSSRIREFDVLHLAGVWQPTSLAAYRAARTNRVPYVVSPRGMLSEYSFRRKAVKKALYWWLFERKNLNRARAIHYTASFEKTECARLRLRPECVVVPNSIDFDAWTRSGGAALEWRQHNGVGEDEFLFLSAGRLHHKKGLELLLEAAASLPKGRKWRLIFAGPDEDGTGKALAARAAAAGYINRLIFTGSIDTPAMAALFSAADVFLFPSRNENFGNVAVEALACGVRLLVSDGVGVAGELVDLDGVRVVSRDVTQWAAAMRELMETSRLEERVMEARRRSLVKRFGVEGVAEAMESTYLSLL